MPPDSYDSPAKYEKAIHAELEERDYYIEKNVFWVPALARWKTVQDSAKLPPGTEITVKNGKTTTYKITSTGKLIDDALEAIEKENPKLKGVLDRRYTQLQIDPANLSSLIDLIAGIPFQHADLHAKDILGHVHLINHPSSSSASLGDLCASAVQNSSMAIRSIDFNFGKEPANSFTQDQHPDLRADYVMASLPFNLKERWIAKLVLKPESSVVTHRN